MDKSRNNQDSSSKERVPVARNQSMLSPLEQIFDPLKLLGDFFGRNAFQSMERLIPHVDIEERESEYLVTVDLPGVKPEDVDVEVAENQLSIKGERKSREGEAGRGTRYYGSFERILTLPAGCDSNQISAQFENGELVLHIPRSEQSRRRRIDIARGQAQSKQPRH
jgi:HSP20 family protein